jgi:hypothetical protein
MAGGAAGGDGGDNGVLLSAKAIRIAAAIFCRITVAADMHVESRQVVAEQTSRRFPPPWSIDEQSACFVVRDHNGQQLAHVYFEDERRRAAALGARFARSLPHRLDLRVNQ